MNKLVVSLCTFLLASAGWWLGEQVGGPMSAFAISMVGTGAGVYVGKRIIGLWDL